MTEKELRERVKNSPLRAFYGESDEEKEKEMKASVPLSFDSEGRYLNDEGN